MPDTAVSKFYHHLKSRRTLIRVGGDLNGKLAVLNISDTALPHEMTLSICPPQEN